MRLGSSGECATVPCVGGENLGSVIAGTLFSLCHHLTHLGFRLLARLLQEQLTGLLGFADHLLCLGSCGLLLLTG